MHNIQPVLMAKKARFQMPTPLKASEKGKISYAGVGGGIDILARVGKGSGNGTKLCIIEVKDEHSHKEPPKTAIKQALVYATFIRELLRSEQGILVEDFWARGGGSFKAQDMCCLRYAVSRRR